MGKFKVLLFLVGFVIATLIAAAVAVPLYFDPNEHKQEIAEQVRKQTGRDLTITGDIELSVFPWLGIDLGTVELGNAPGFGDKPFARIEQLRVRIKLMPLLKKQIEMNTVVVHGLTLNLARNKDGVNNWDDMVSGKSGGDDDTPAKRGAAIGGLAIGGLDIRNANLSWTDAVAGQSQSVTGLSLRTGAIEANQPLDLELEFDVNTSAPALQGHITLRGILGIDIPAQRYNTDDLKLTADLSGESLPGGAVTLTLQSPFDIDLQKQTLSLPELVLQIANMDLRGSLQAKSIIDDPMFNGSLKVGAFNLRDLMDKLSLEPPATADDTVLGETTLQAQFSGSTSDIAIEDLKLTLDQTSLSGRVRVDSGGKTPDISFNLAVDRIDADRYLPPAGAAGRTPAATTPGGTAAAGGWTIPTAQIRALKLNGHVSIGELVISKLKMRDIQLSVDAKNGLVRLHPFTAHLYRGVYSGDIELDARKDTPRISVNESMKDIQAGPLLQDMVGKSPISGTANVSTRLTGVISGPDALKRTLKGSMKFAFNDGAVEGVDIPALLRKAKALLKGQAPPAENGPLRTDFTELSGSVNIADGVARNTNLSAKSPFFRLNGNGQANLINETVDYRMELAVVNTSAGQGGKSLKDLSGIKIPVKVTGNLNQPSYALDMDSLLKTEAKKQIQKKIENKLGDQLKNKLPGALGDSLKGLFGR